MPESDDVATKPAGKARKSDADCGTEEDLGPLWPEKPGKPAKLVSAEKTETGGIPLYFLGGVATAIGAWMFANADRIGSLEASIGNALVVGGFVLVAAGAIVAAIEKKSR